MSIGLSLAESGALATPGQAILDLKTHGLYVACITESSLQLWLGGPHLTLVGWVEHKQHELAQLGANAKLAWHPDGQILALLTQQSHVLFYQMDSSGTAEPNSPGADDARMLSLRLRARTAVGQRFGQGLCLVVDSSAIALGCGGDAAADGCVARLAMIGWGGQLIEAVSISTTPPCSEPSGGASSTGAAASAALICEAYLENACGTHLEPAHPALSKEALWQRLVCLSVCDRLSCIGVVGGAATACSAVILFYHGRLGTLSLRRSTTSAHDVDCIMVQRASAASIALCSSSSMVAVGSLDGQLRLYALVPPPSSPSACAESRSASSASAAAVSAPLASPSPLLQLSIGQWTLSSPGAASCVAFSHNGESVAVGYEATGAAIFSLSGTLCALWPAATQPLPSGKPQCAGAALRRGVAALAWGAYDAQLFAAAAVVNHGTEVDEADGDCLYVLPLLRTSSGRVGAAHCAGERELCLLGADHIRLSRLSHSLEPSSWRIIPPPSSYTDRSWPLRLVALSDGLHQLAVAGERGVAVTPLHSLRWRFLGASATQHLPFRAEALLWLSRDALLVVARHAEGEGSIANAEKPTPLFMLVLSADLRSILLRQDLDQPKLRGGVWGCARPSTKTLLLGVGRYICLLSVVLDSREAAMALGIPLRVAISLSEIVPLPVGSAEGAGLSALDASKKEFADSADDKHAHAVTDDMLFETIVLLRDGGVLLFTHLREPSITTDGTPVKPAGLSVPVNWQTPEALVSPAPTTPPQSLTASVFRPPPSAERTSWLTISPMHSEERTPNCSPLVNSRLVRLLPSGCAYQSWQDRGCIYTLSQHGLWQWEWSALPSGLLQLDSDDDRREDQGWHGTQLLPVPREVLPLAVISELGAVVGVSYMPLPSATDAMVPKILAEPLLHRQLLHLLLEGRLEFAKSIALRSSFRRGHCFEVLLHEALGSSKSAVKPSPLLVSAIDLLRELGERQFVLAIARCARKTDVSYWEQLFAVCGQPSQLLQQCLHAQEPDFAAAFLVPVQTLEGLQACRDAIGCIRQSVISQAHERLLQKLDTFEVRLQEALHIT